MSKEEITNTLLNDMKEKVCLRNDIGEFGNVKTILNDIINEGLNNVLDCGYNLLGFFALLVFLG